MTSAEAVSVLIEEEMEVMMPISACWVWLCVAEPSAFILGEDFSKRAVKPGPYLRATFGHAWPRVCVCVR